MLGIVERGGHAYVDRVDAERGVGSLFGQRHRAVSHRRAAVDATFYTRAAAGTSNPCARYARAARAAAASTSGAARKSGSCTCSGEDMQPRGVPRSPRSRTRKSTGPGSATRASTCTSAGRARAGRNARLGGGAGDAWTRRSDRGEKPAGRRRESRPCSSRRTPRTKNSTSLRPRCRARPAADASMRARTVAPRPARWSKTTLLIKADKNPNSFGVRERFGAARARRGGRRAPRPRAGLGRMADDRSTSALRTVIHLRGLRGTPSRATPTSLIPMSTHFERSGTFTISKASATDSSRCSTSPACAQHAADVFAETRLMMADLPSTASSWCSPSPS